MEYHDKVEDKAPEITDVPVHEEVWLMWILSTLYPQQPTFPQIRCYQDLYVSKRLSHC